MTNREAAGKVVDIIMSDHGNYEAYVDLVEIVIDDGQCHGLEQAERLALMSADFKCAEKIRKLIRGMDKR